MTGYRRAAVPARASRRRVIIAGMLIGLSACGQQPSIDAPSVPGPLDWDFAVVQPGGTQLVVHYVHSVCNSLGRVEVHQDDSAVAIRLESAPARQSSRACPAVAALGDVTVSLDRPLGGRLLTGCNGRQYPSCLAPGR